MRKVLLIAVIAVSAAFAYNAMLGTKGTFETYAADCENMGMLNLLSPHLYFMIDDILGVGVTGLGPSATISFTPWHYLEFSVFANTVIAMVEPLSGMAYADGNGGGIVKGGVPIYLGSERRSFIAPGVAGFIYYKPSLMHLDLSSWGYGSLGADIAGLGFGGMGLVTVDVNSWFRLHINGGYRSLSIQSGFLSLSSIAGMDIINNYLTSKPTIFDPLTLNNPIATEAVMAGVSLEFWPAEFLGIIVDGVAEVPQIDMRNFLNYVYVVPGLRLGLGGTRTRFNIDLGGKFDLPDNTSDPFGWAVMGGVGVAFDLMPDQGMRIKGIVVDRETAEPVVGAKVYVSGHPGTMEPYITDTDGRFTLKVPEGGYTLAAEHPDYIPLYLESDLIDLEEGMVMLELVPKTAGAVVMGTVSDEESKVPVSAQIEFQRLDAEVESINVTTDPVTGYYRAAVPDGSYRLNVTAYGYKKTHKSMMLVTGDEIIVDFALKPTFEKGVEPGEIVSLPSIYFEKGGDWISQYDYSVLEDALRMLKTNPGARVELHGHTDSVGEAEMNYHLSVKRAEAVRQYLVQHGVSGDRIRVIGFGEFEPKGDNRTRSGRKENRRVDIVTL
ncbi:carboxypeptidase regulatory-like domain-containing protein [candidate division WOR-3 bacterium]|nr:carboxypeptidase regulatory-like domain-containing protein [candidate division WOR-3 bacterium]